MISQIRIQQCNAMQWETGIQVGANQSTQKYVVKHKSAKLFMTYAVGKLDAALNISHLILSTSSLRVSQLELVGQSQLDFEQV